MLLSVTITEPGFIDSPNNSWGIEIIEQESCKSLSCLFGLIPPPKDKYGWIIFEDWGSFGFPLYLP